MDAKELLKKVRRIEIKTRGLSQNIFAGEYHSAFKGRGMTFAEVREYQYGDDIRDIDWNVTARHNHPFVKVYEEERELTVMLLVDVSGSRLFGAVGEEKRDCRHARLFRHPEQRQNRRDILLRQNREIHSSEKGAQTYPVHNP